MRLSPGRTLGRDIPIMEAVKIDLGLFQEFKKDGHTRQGIVERLTPVIPRHESRAHTEGVPQRVAHAVPVGRAKA